MEPLCYGQLSVLRWLQATPRRRWGTANIKRVMPLDGFASVADVREALADAGARYESLRTTYDLSRPAQIVHPSCDLPVVVVDLPDTDQERVRRLAASRYERGFTLTDDLGWEAVIATVRGRPQALVITMNHIVADGWGFNVVAERLAAWPEAGGGPGEGGGGEEAAPRVLAAEQRSPAWAERRAAARSYWTDLLRSAPRTPPAAVNDERRVSGTAPLGRASGAVTSVARRERVFPQAVVLALMAVTIARLTGSRRFLLWLMVSNRFEPRWRVIVTSMNQAIPIVVEVRPGEAFSELLARLQRSSVTAVRHGCYDVDDARRLAVEITGRPATIEYLVNYATRAWPPELPAAELARTPVARFGVTESQRPAAAPFYAIVEGEAELSVAVHTYPTFDAGAFLRGFYDALVAAATTEDVAADALLGGGAGGPARHPA